MISKPIAVLLLSHGTPRSKEDFPQFLTSIAKGRKPSDNLLNEIIRRYNLIGGLSPLNDIIEKQIACLATSLNSDGHFEIVRGFKHISPTIEDTVELITSTKYSFVVILVMTSYHSRLSTGEYIERALNTIDENTPNYAVVQSFHDNSNFVNLLANRIQHTSKRLSDYHVLFSTHSLPVTQLDDNEQYQSQHLKTSSLVATQLGIHSHNWTSVYQSAGLRGGKWLGPDIKIALNDISKNGCKNFIICPCGFLSDNAEILFDIDIDVKSFADELGVNLIRTESLNDDPQFIELLKNLILEVCPKELVHETN